MPELTYDDDRDSGLVEFFVDGKLITTWTYEDEAEIAFFEFKKIFDAGCSAGIEEFKSELSESVSIMYRPHIEGVVAVLEEKRKQTKS